MITTGYLKKAILYMITELSLLLPEVQKNYVFVR